MRRPRPVFFLAMWLLAAFLTGACAFADSDQKSIGDARKELSQSSLGSKQYPWYSAESDGAEFVPFPKERKEKERKPPREREVRPPREASSFWSFFAQMSYTTMFVIGLLVVAVILLAAWYLLFRNRDVFRKLWKKEELKERRRRIETLPEEARDMFDDLIGAARRAFEAGQYREALIYYFSHQLVWLDMHGLIRMHKGKTNHEYARELSRELPSSSEVPPLYEKSMALFESVYYGDHPITRLLFLGIWEHRNDFSRAVREEKQRRDEAKQQRFRNNGMAMHRDSLSLSVEMPQSQGNASGNTTSPGNNASRGGTLMLLFALATGTMFGTAGCRQEVQTDYVPLSGYDKSVNGISVFNNMTVRQGHALRSGMRANSYVKNGDVLIWFARRTGGPEDGTVRQIEDWLNAKPGRTFVYVGRAFESTYDYWSAVEGLAPTPEDRQKIIACKQDAAVELQGFLESPAAERKKETDEKTDESDDADKLADTKTADTKTDDGKMQPEWSVLLEGGDFRIGETRKCDWFEASPRKQRYRVTAISGDTHWTDGIDAEKLHLTCFEDWAFADDVEPLLVVDGETVVPLAEPQPVTDQTLVARKQVGQSQAIFVAHAGFLLNYPLVNHEHRKLAGRLIESFGEPKKRVFVYSARSDINLEKSGEVSDESPHVLLTLLHIWPLSIILCHVIVLCTAFCFYKWPVFGRPKREKEAQVADFSKHIDAYAALLAEAKDDDYATRQIAEAQDRQKRELM